MSFLNPAFLYGLGAAILPLLIHLFNRRRATTVQFSNVALLRQLQQDRMRRVRIRQVLLLILRTLVVLALVLGFARPVLREPTGSPFGARLRTSAALALDQSYGMGYRTPTGRLFDRAKTRVDGALSLFDERDNVELIPFSDHPRSFNPTSPGDLREQLISLEVTNRIPRIGNLLKRIVEFLSASKEHQKEVFLFTNLARVGWSGLGDSLASFKDVAVYVVPERPGAVENLAVTRLSASNQIVMIGSPIAIDIEISNTGEVPKRDIPVRFWFDGKRVGQTVIDLKAGERKGIVFQVSPDRSGKTVGFAEAGDDPLPVDNTRYVVVDVPDKIEAILIGGSGKDTYYLQRAFSLGEDPRLVKAKSTTQDRLLATDIVQSELIVFSDVTRPSPGQIALVRDRVRRGGGALIFLGGKIDLNYYNERVLPHLLPIKLVALRRTRGTGRAYRSLGEMKRGHPLFRELLPKAFQAPRFFASFDVARAKIDRVQTIASYGDGGAAMLEARLGKGRVILFTSAVDLEWSDLPLRGLFVPLLHRIAQYAVAHPPMFEAYPVGQTAERPVLNDGATADIISPDGLSQVVRAEGSEKGPVFRIGPLELPGVWEVRSEDRVSDNFASAIDAETGSDLSPISHDRLRRIFGKGRLHIVEPDESLPVLVKKKSSGQELRGVFLGAALALMIAEVFIGRRSASRDDRKRMEGMADRT